MTLIDKTKRGGKMKRFLTETMSYFNPKYPLFVFNIVVIIALIGFIFLFFSTMPMNNLPSDIVPAYKTIENSGFLGTAEYYIFDTNGNRYHVYQDIFDRYNNLPRK